MNIKWTVGFGLFLVLMAARTHVSEAQTASGAAGSGAAAAGSGVAGGAASASAASDPIHNFFWFIGLIFASIAQVLKNFFGGIGAFLGFNMDDPDGSKANASLAALLAAQGSSVAGGAGAIGSGAASAAGR